MNIYFASPVRKASWWVKLVERSYVEELERCGHTVHWPLRDTPQLDSTGYLICHRNLEAIKGCDAVHLLWYGDSQGTLFDLGMAFALGKPLVIVYVAEPKEKGKCFERMFVEWQRNNKWSNE